MSGKDKELRDLNTSDFSMNKDIYGWAEYQNVHLIDTSNVFLHDWDAMSQYSNVERVVDRVYISRYGMIVLLDLSFFKFCIQSTQ